MLLLFVTIAAACPANATSGSPSYSIRLEDAASAVLTMHPELAGEQLELPATVASREPAPALEAGPLERWAAPSQTISGGVKADTTAAMGRIRLRCQSESICLPFYVWVHLPASSAAVFRERAQAAQPAPVLHTGAHASMLIDSGMLHLRIPVTCLQAGAVGATIRVTGPSRSRVYQAAIIDGTTVRGSL